MSKIVLGIIISFFILMIVSSVSRDIQETDEGRIRLFITGSSVGSRGHEAIQFRFNADGIGEGCFMATEDFDLNAMLPAEFIEGVYDGSLYPGCHTLRKGECVQRCFNMQWALKKNVVTMDFTTEQGKPIAPMQLRKTFRIRDNGNGPFLEDGQGRFFYN